MFFNFFKISILSLCIIILIHYLINYLQIILTKPKIIDYRKKIKKEEKEEKEEEKKEEKEEKEEENEEKDIIDLMKDELTEYLNNIK
jgi:hypothetical protein